MGSIPIAGRRVNVADIAKFGTGIAWQRSARQDEPRYRLGHQTLHHGSSGHAVIELRRALQDAGIPAAPRSLVFDRDLAEAVSTYQRRRGLRVDGIVGRDTMSALQSGRRV